MCYGLNFVAALQNVAVNSSQTCAMAAQSGPRLIDPFTKLLKTLALELTPNDIETILFLLTDHLEPNENLNELVKPNQDNAGIRLFSYLRKRGIVLVNDLNFLIQLFNESNRQDLAKKVETHQSSVKFVTCLPTRPSNEVVHEFKDMALVHFYFWIPGGAGAFTDNNREEISNAIKEGLDIQYIFFDNVKDSHPKGFIDVTFKLPANDNQIMKLQNDALNKKGWLTAMRVHMLEVDGKSQIRIQSESKCEKVSSQASMPVHAVKSVLGSEQAHSSDEVDIILAIEAPHTVNVHQCKSVVRECEQGIKEFESHKRLSLITYGNHTTHRSQCFVAGWKGFKEVNMSIKEKAIEIGRCGGNCDGNSGIADALKQALCLTKEFRPQATKVCIITCFLGNRSSDLEYYRCCHDYDPIKLCYSLAEHCVPLYIIGIVKQNQSHISQKENHFLSGITHITGGRYFEVADIKLLHSVVNSVLKETTAIESNMGTVSDIVIQEIDHQYGDINDVHLADHLNAQLLKRNVHVNKIEVNQGVGLQPISRLSERVAWANDLDDAIEGVKNMTITHRVPEQQITQGIQLSDSHDADVEMSSRMVMRQLNRLAYNI